MIGQYPLHVVIVDPGIDGGFVRTPFGVEKASGRKRVPFQATIDGIPYRGTPVRMGESCHILIIEQGLSNVPILSSHPVQA